MTDFFSKYIKFLTPEMLVKYFTPVIFVFLFVVPNYSFDTKKSVKTEKKADTEKKTNGLPKRGKTEKGFSKANSRSAISSRLMLNKPLAEFTKEDKKQNRINLELLRRRPTTQQFFSIVQEGEAGTPKIMVGNKCPALTAKLDLSRHPGEVLPSKCFYWYVNKKGKLVFSTASGNYQITRDNYRKIAPFLNISDFKVLSQQLIALELMRRGSSKTKSGLIDLEQGNVRKAVCTGTQDWASSKCSTLEAGKKKDYQKIYDRQVYETGKNTVKNKQKTNFRRERIKTKS